MKIVARTPSTLIVEHRPVFYWAFAAVLAGGLPALLFALAPRGWLVGSVLSALAGVLALLLWGRIATVTFDRARGTVEIARRAPWRTGHRVLLGLDEVARVSLETTHHRGNGGDILLYSVVLESTLGERIPLTAGHRFQPAGLEEVIESIRAFLRSARGGALDGRAP